jgi:hypothetical protein
MTDPINRQAEGRELFGNSEQLESGHEKDHVADPNKMVEDLISRQAAIDALENTKEVAR